jgi:prepilin-type N-terminal cleavage/methylation domain-containing protein
MVKIPPGFSLVEMAVVLIIISLVIGSLLGPMSGSINQQKIALTQQRLEEIKKALLGYAAIKGGLPCPANDKNGIGDMTRCNYDGGQGASGYLPWADLGIEGNDAWGQPFLYRVDSFYVKNSDNYKTTRSALVVQDRQLNALLVPNEAVAIILSYGKNGHPDGGNPQAENKQANKTYIYDSYVENEFDDIVMWVSQSLLVNRLVAAGNWPLP